jgi:hypothetical protein
MTATAPAMLASPTGQSGRRRVEELSTRLLGSAAKKCCDPVVDVDRDAAIPADRYRVQWVLTEIADECRHSVMFARTAETFGVPSCQPPPPILRPGKAFVKRFDASGGLVDFLCDDGLVGGPSELLRKRARMS